MVLSFPAAFLGVASESQPPPPPFFFVGWGGGGGGVQLTMITRARNSTSVAGTFSSLPLTSLKSETL